MNEIKLPQGYKLIANYNDEIVLAQSLNEKNPELYVTWMVHDSGVYTGCYFGELPQAQLSFADRAFGISDIIAEPIFRYGASKEDIEVAQQKVRFYEQSDKVYINENKSYKACRIFDCNCNFVNELMEELIKKSKDPIIKTAKIKRLEYSVRHLINEEVFFKNESGQNEFHLIKFNPLYEKIYNSKYKLISAIKNFCVKNWKLQDSKSLERVPRSKQFYLNF